mmetsp:Transcript_35684/g.50576  ORF Transcript_35684/g.50576 Transcript_35684/m.50576 type:complete len:80 (+) Transcript_35684:70-309(+)
MTLFLQIKTYHHSYLKLERKINTKVMKEVTLIIFHLISKIASSLEFDAEKEPNPNIHQSQRVHVPNPCYQHLHAKARAQ